MPNEAMAALQTAMTKNYPKYYQDQLIEKIGEIYNKTEQFEKCVEHFKPLLATDPKSELPHDSLPYCLANLARFDDAVKAAMDSHGDHPICYPISKTLRRRAEHNLGMYNLDKAESDLKLSLQYEMSSETYLSLAKVAKARQEYDKAVNLVFDGAKIDNNDSKFFYEAMDAFSDHFESVQKIAHKNIELRPQGSERIVAYHLIGKVYGKAGKLTELETEMSKGAAEGERYLQSNPQDANAFILMGNLYVIWANAAKKKEILLKGIAAYEAGRKNHPTESAFLKYGDETKKLMGEWDAKRAPASVPTAPKK
jgi:tetratricopeptide (TPR) repeat protein